MDDIRKLLLDIYAAGLDAVNGYHCVNQFLQQHPVQQSLYLIAIGKAASAMSQAVLTTTTINVADGLVITKKGYAESLTIPTIESAHPLPDQSSLDAGQALLSFIETTPEDAQILFLLSGGASALVEVLVPAARLEDLQQLNAELLASGVDIQAINLRRGKLSQIKQGGLKKFLQGRSIQQLIISDVIGDDLAIIGSGLLYPDDEQVHSSIVANNHQALQAMAAHAKQLGHSVHLHTELLQGDAEQCAKTLIASVADKPAGIYIFGGETTVQLPEHPGKGGRNQQFALAAAIACMGNDKLTCLAAATDGTDGPTDDAGAIIDGKTIAKGIAAGLDANQYLQNADAGTFLAATEDLISTGPTGTNVMDVVVIYKY